MTHISSSKLGASLAAIKDSSDASALKGNQPVIVSEVDKKHANLATSSLADLFGSNPASTARVCFYVTAVQPGSTAEACKSYNKGSKKASSAKGSKGGDMIYQVQFLAKDVSTQSNNNVYKILLYTHEGLGSNFFRQKAANLHSDSKAESAVQGAFNTLTRFNSWVDAVV
jgi:hypothetical protein